METPISETKFAASLLTTQEGRGADPLPHAELRRTLPGWALQGGQGETAQLVEKESLKCRGRKSTAFFDFRVKSGLKFPSCGLTGNFILLIRSPLPSSALRRGDSRTLTQ